MKAWLLVLLCACDQGAKPAPPKPVPVVVHDAQTEQEHPCFRRYKTYMSSCSGVPNNDPPAQVEVCDECADDTQCTWKPGGKCSDVGDGICWGPRHRICKYPQASCGNQICPEPEYTLPPSAAPSPRPGAR